MERDDSDEQIRAENLRDYKIRQLERLVKSYEARIRDLEDFKLATKVTHKNMVRWITIAASSFAAAISLLEHILFK